MENKENDFLFDDMIRNSMRRMEENSDDSLSSDFDLFEKRLRRVEKTEDDAFDNWIRNAAERHEAPQNAAHWARMERELEETFSWKRYLIRFKMPELVLSGLAIWTFFNVVDAPWLRNDASVPQNKQIVPSTSTKSKALDSKIVPLSVPKLETPTLNPKSDWNKRAGDAPRNPLKTKGLEQTPLLQFQASEGAPQAMIENPTLSTEVVVAGGTAGMDSQNTLLSRTVQDITATLPIRTNSDLAHETGLDEDNVQFLLNDATSNYLVSNGLDKSKKEIPSVEATVARLNAGKKSVELLSTLAMIQPELLKTEVLSSVQMPVLEGMGYRNRRLRVGMFGAFNADNAKTFFSSLTIGGKAVRATDGYGSGATVGYRRGKVEIESGLTYSYKNYRPVELTSVTGDFNNGYEVLTPKLVSFNMLHIPVHVNYYFLDKKKWNFYGVAGSTATVAMQTDYDISQMASPQYRADLNATQNSVTNLYKKGALEGASWDKNYYFTVNAGAGVEFNPKRNGRWSVFGQWLYQQHIGNQGVGANQDKISTFSIQVGAKARL
jgi:hypothetical protein